MISETRRNVWWQLSWRESLDTMIEVLRQRHTEGEYFDTRTFFLGQGEGHETYPLVSDHLAAFRSRQALEEMPHGIPAIALRGDLIEPVGPRSNWEAMLPLAARVPFSHYLAGRQKILDVGVEVVFEGAVEAFFTAASTLTGNPDTSLVPIPYGNLWQSDGKYHCRYIVTDPAAAYNARLSQALNLLDALRVSAVVIPCKRGLFGTFYDDDGEITVAQIPGMDGPICHPMTTPGVFELSEVTFYTELADEGVLVLKNESPPGLSGRFDWIPDSLAANVFELLALKDFTV